MAGQEVDVGILATDKQDSFPGRDASMNIERKYITHERIPQRDQTHTVSEKESRQIIERNQVRSVNGHATRAKLALDAIGLRSCSVQPEPKAIPRLAKILRVSFDERVLIVGDAPIARV